MFFSKNSAPSETGTPAATADDPAAAVTNADRASASKRFIWQGIDLRPLSYRGMPTSAKTIRPPERAAYRWLLLYVVGVPSVRLPPRHPSPREAMGPCLPLPLRERAGVRGKCQK